MPQVGTLTRAMTPIGNSMTICLPIYHPHSPSGVFILFAVVFVVCACPNNNWIRFHFLSQHHIFKFVFLPGCLRLLKWPVIREFLVTLDMNTYHVFKFTYLYTWHITNVIQSPYWWIWTKLNKILFDLVCKSDDPLRLSQEYPKVCVYFSVALTSISMSKITPKLHFKSVKI